MHYNTEHNIDKYKSTFTTKAYIYDFILNENSIYKGCPSCSKKLSELKEQNKFGCLPCNKMYNEPKYTFILIIRVRDANDNAYFKLIGTKANKILGIEPEQLKQLLDTKRFRDIESLEKLLPDKEKENAGIDNIREMIKRKREETNSHRKKFSKGLFGHDIYK